jgi:glycosyltransferase involved in cell wall biosynthesis
VHRYNPRISVVIRTIGRPCIARALRSLDAQHYRNLEALIVMARPTSLPTLPALETEWRLVEAGLTLDRPSAANAGLDHCRGDLIVFLDDDDEFDARHLRSLVDCLAAHPGSRVAYSATRILGENDETLGSIGQPFDRLALHGQNVIQIGAGLFEHSLVEDGCRFDEDMHLFQDWDFWLQATMHTSFAYTGVDTNLWRAHTGGSGAGLGTNLNSDLTNQYHERLLAKWAPVRQSLAARVDTLVQRVKHLRADGRNGDADLLTAELKRLVSGSVVESVPVPAQQSGAVARDRRSQFA